jgi:hypothetical protein
MTKHIKDELDAAGDSQLLENSVDVIPDRMLLHLLEKRFIADGVASTG